VEPHRRFPVIPAAGDNLTKEMAVKVQFRLEITSKAGSFALLTGNVRGAADPAKIVGVRVGPGCGKSPASWGNRGARTRGGILECGTQRFSTHRPPDSGNARAPWRKEKRYQKCCGSIRGLSELHRLRDDSRHARTKL